MSTRSPQRPTPDSSSEHPDARGTRSSPGRASAVVAVRRLFGAETGSYFLLLGTTLFLIALGLVMVLSASSVTSFVESDQFFGGFERQAIFAGLGLPLMLLASRAPASFWKRWAPIAIAAALALQFLTVATGLGYSVNGNRNWIDLGGFRFQPSETVKLALVIWMALILSRKQKVIDDWRQLIFPFAPIAGAGILFVLLGGDLGTGVILATMVLGTLFFAGVRLHHLAIAVLALGAGALAMISLGSGSRASRIEMWQGGCVTTDDFLGQCWQSLHGWWALASGGIFGRGLGNSKSKWNWLPEADNDFIFAIIGEELGFVGAATVLILFVVMLIAFVRIIRTNPDPFAKIAVSTVMVWIVGQAFVNIAVVLGVLPVLGVPLPFISAGGTALISGMLAIGVALSFARRPAQSRAGVPRQ